MDKNTALSLLWERDVKLNRIGHIESLIGWDRETGAPEKSGEEQAEMLELLSALYYNTAVSPETEEAVDSLEESDFAEPEKKAMVRAWKKYFRTEARLGADFVSRWALAVGKAESKWLEARKAKDFKIFAPYLEELVSLAREKARLIDSTKEPYDVLLDLYEPGTSQKMLDPMFEVLASVIHHLMAQKNECDDSFLKAGYSEEVLHLFSSNVSKEMGFDLSRGKIGLSAHPFTTTLGRDDVRITTRYTDPSLFDPISSIIHETGHALYDQNAALNEKVRDTRLATGVSMGIHESQSRFWENMMGKSRAFWAHEYPSLKAAVPSLESVSLDEFVAAINKVEITPIRVNADELTYSLHVILRYELEKKLIAGTLEVKDLPEAWRIMSLCTLGYAPKDDVEGVLQDCHWAGGDFGYFPTYVLGNFYGAMFLEEMKKTVDVEKALEEGDFAKITAWQNEHIWRHGSIYTPSELLWNVTGKKLDANAFCKYLMKKYSK